MKDDSVELVEVAYAQSQPEAEVIQGLLESEGIPSVLRPLGVSGPQLGFGLLPNSPQRVQVNARDAERARSLLAESMAEQENAPPDPVNLSHLEDATGRKPRSYGLAGAYARIYFWSAVSFAVAFGVFLLLRVA